MTAKHIEIQVKTDPKPCRIIFGSSPQELPSQHSDRTVLICDPEVLLRHSHRLPPRFRLITLKKGEAHKTLSTVRRLYLDFLRHGVDRSFLIIGVGGGITCDITGFAAATFMRGIPFAFIPTTLLAQVDAALGGKNGVNLKGYKNMVGSFAQPQFVFCDPEFLGTLSLGEFRCGLAELVKSAAVADAELFTFLEEQADTLLDRDETVLQQAILGAQRVKLELVKRDEREHGERRLLNFGHTLAHALEKSGPIRHGEAVSIGMSFACTLSVHLGLAKASEMKRLTSLLHRLGLPLAMEAQRQSATEALGKDKKNRGQAIDLVLLKQIGEGTVRTVPRIELEAYVNDLFNLRQTGLPNL